MHHEVLTRIDTGGERLVEPGLFLPMANRLGLAASLDRVIIDAALAAWLRTRPGAEFGDAAGRPRPIPGGDR